MNHQYVIIMAGGVGSRFWPISRTDYPKQFHDVLGTGKSLLQQTVDRFDGICEQSNIYVVTNESYGSLVQKQLPFISDDQLLLEPCGKNTAPCIAYAVFKILAKDPEATFIISPADHVIIKEEEFKKKVRVGLEAIHKEDMLLTLGIEPHRPDTGYGYIKFKPSDDEVKKVEAFTEKPDLETAKSFVQSGDYVWNAGIFLWNGKAIQAAFSTLAPDLTRIFQQEDVYYTEKEPAFVQEAYTVCPSISIDYAIMEKARNVRVVLCNIGWSDLGTWKSLYALSEKDENGNVLEGNIRAYKTKDCIVKAPKDKLVVTQGLEGFIVADHGNVLLICKKEEEQQVKAFVESLKKDDLKEFY